MRNTLFSLGAAAVLTLALNGSSAARPGQRRVFQAVLSGYQATPAISTTGEGDFRAELNSAQTALDYELSYSDLEGGTPTAAHVHLGQAGVAGGVSFFLCGGGGKPACPASGKVTGTVVAADVIGPAAQGITAGEFAEALTAMRSGVTYVNVHNATYPNGEIRGQLGSGRGLPPGLREME